MTEPVQQPSINDQMHDRIRAWLPENGDVVFGIEAAKFVAHLEETDSDFLSAWLSANAVAFMTMTFGRITRRDRSSARRREKTRPFTDAANAHANGDSESLSHFKVRYVIDNEENRRTVGEMTGADHSFVAASYQRSGSRDLMLASFHRAVAKMVGKKRTSEVMDEATYDEVLRSISTRMSAA